MALVTIDWSPTERQLFQFAWLSVLVLPLATWMLELSTYVTLTAALVGLALVLLAHWQPVVMRPIYIGANLLAAPIGMVAGELAMLVIYFIVLLPIGCAFRILRRDALKLEIQRDEQSYWQTKDESGDQSSYYRQY